jgi:hypothetical protein
MQLSGVKNGIARQVKAMVAGIVNCKPIFPGCKIFGLAI